TELYCDGNQLISLDLSANSQLVSIDCFKNNLIWLNIDNCAELTDLDCTNNNIAKLNTGGCPKLKNFKHDSSTIIVSEHVPYPIVVTEGTKPTILTKTLKTVAAGVDYKVQLLASGTQPITWSVSSKTKLPSGFSLSESGLLTGRTNSKLAAKKITVTASNSAGDDTADFTLSALIPPQISTASLKDATVNKSYSVTMKTSKGTKQYNGTKYFKWTAEGLPSGLTINVKTGRISGKPTVSGTFSVTITAENDAGEYSRSYNLNVKGIAPTISGSFKKAELNKNYSSGLKLTKGSQPVVWSIEGNLPEGLTLDPNTGIIYGTPTEYGKNGTFKFKITATNSAGKKTKSISFKVTGKKPTIKTTKLPNATVGQAYSATLTATGSDTITWTAVTLPTFLQLDGNTIMGTVPESFTKSSFKITVAASNPVKKNVKKTYTVKVSKPKKAQPEKPETVSENNSENKISENHTGVDTGVAPETHSTSGVGTGDVSGSYEIVAELGVISADKSDMYEFGVALSDDVPAGAELVYIANSDKPSDDDKIAEFYDDTGKEITAVPESRRITISIWLNKGTTYNPAVGIKR
ncbi:MAG: putative Ig domain-containing protein, partial [Synergistaceae bacterium]|nr:putative Ig domain-containing protein [Synergistaceae bacterium]